MKQYKFVKLQRTDLKDYIHTWILECSDLETLIEHTEKYMNTQIKNGIQDYIDETKGYRHFKTHWGSLIKKMQNINGESMINVSLNMEQKVIQGKIKNLIKYKTLYLRPNGSYMVPYKNLKIIDEIIMSKMTYPEFTENDILIQRWNGGTHYYANIAGLTVVDDQGNQKWDTYAEAQNQALIYLKNHNQ